MAKGIISGKHHHPGSKSDTNLFSTACFFVIFQKVLNSAGVSADRIATNKKERTKRPSCQGVAQLSVLSSRFLDNSHENV